MKIHLTLLACACTSAFQGARPLGVVPGREVSDKRSLGLPGREILMRHTSPNTPQALWDSAAPKALAALAAATIWLGGATGPPAALATDTAAIGKCVINSCKLPLAKCVLDPKCAANLVCINTCNNRPDEIECQIRCGDLFGGQAADEFNSCTVTEKKCVPQRQDSGEYPVPANEVLVKDFDVSAFDVGDGVWYITAGQNPSFDIFDCQKHEFAVPGPGKLVGNLQWRIPGIVEPQYKTAYTVQEFLQDPKQSAVLYNHDNEYLHYQDDWYIIGYQPAKYIFVYYRGSNDAWDGYGGAVVYTRDSKLPMELVPELTKDAAKVGMKWSDFAVTDNTCKPKESAQQELVEDFQFVQNRVGGTVLNAENTIAKNALALEIELGKDIQNLEIELGQDIQKAEEEVVVDLVKTEIFIEDSLPPQGRAKLRDFFEKVNLR